MAVKERPRKLWAGYYHGMFIGHYETGGKLSWKDKRHFESRGSFCNLFGTENVNTRAVPWEE